MMLGLPAASHLLLTIAIAAAAIHAAAGEDKSSLKSLGSVESDSIEADEQLQMDKCSEALNQPETLTKMANGTFHTWSTEKK
jgi:hypothetical protein